MNELQELRQRIAHYRKLLGEVHRPFRSDHDELAERLFSRLLREATQRLQAVEQATVKLHTKPGTPQGAWSVWRSGNAGSGPLNPDPNHSGSAQGRPTGRFGRQTD